MYSVFTQVTKPVRDTNLSFYKKEIVKKLKMWIKTGNSL